ncbi:hypothetical protein H6G76_36195 [Nostoc sp. FACHB-152]|uniref:hypothetical protein n=1 Tax=unclassified Nostoc TaxID=2593658 RepID=UPI00168426FE|nr:MULTISPECIES: hypothetical protein [unclassified Nostoc]MBD2452445.1 hypothetical protein [Nostoc sp. FACHB-152]MBD2473312.1 hypothetical protein [Nostoc sp. FACHB-145]
MKFYLTNVSPNLPPWATLTSQTPNLVELEINDNHPDFQSLLNGLASEIQPGIVGVKSADLCEALVDRCGSVGSVPFKETSILV